MIKVIVEVYKPWGSYYDTGSYESQKNEIHQIFEEVREMAIHGKIPGLRDGSAWTDEPWERDWILRVTVPGHINEHPTLIPFSRDALGSRVWASDAWYQVMRAAPKPPTKSEQERERLKAHGIEYT